MCCGSDPTNRVNVLQLDVSNKERYSYYRFSSDIDEGDSATAAADDDNNDGTSSISMDTFRSISVGESIYGKSTALIISIYIGTSIYTHP